MKKHLLCLTVDTDPDGLSARTPNRQSLEWSGLEHARGLADGFDQQFNLGDVPITWFIRADGQLESILGSTTYLLDCYQSFWASLQDSQHELAWHPHLYRQLRPEDPAVVITDPLEAQDELERLWNQVKEYFAPTAFRNGEGWHLPETYDTVERLGFHCDSTAIPGRKGSEGHPMNWEAAPNQPYFPSPRNLRVAGQPRPLLEVPMNSWFIQAPYDAAPRTRYMDPAVHPHLFAHALKGWAFACQASPHDLNVWVMIFHPDEVLPTMGADSLYSRSISDLTQNLSALVETLRRLEDEFEWSTISKAAERWRVHQLQFA